MPLVPSAVLTTEANCPVGLTTGLLISAADRPLPVDALYRVVPPRASFWRTSRAKDPDRSE